MRTQVSVIALVVIASGPCLTAQQAVAPSQQVWASRFTPGQHVLNLARNPTRTNAQRVALEHLKDAVEDFGDRYQIATAHPLYRPDLNAIAYYEFVIKRITGETAGFVVVATGAHDYSVPTWSLEGESNVEALVRAARESGRTASRYYMLDSLSFAAEDSGGNLVAVVGHLRVAPMEWPFLKKTYAVARADYIHELQLSARPEWTPVSASVTLPEGAHGLSLSGVGFWCGDWKKHSAGTSADQLPYRQLGRGESPNTSECSSGCGATAWAMLFGWADRNAAATYPVYPRSSGLYDTEATAPAVMDDAVRAMIWELRGDLETECTGVWGLFEGMGRVYPWNMDQAVEYLVRRTNSARGVDVRYNKLSVLTSGFLTTSELRDRADRIIRSGRPAIIMLGDEHYALAWEYRKKKCVGWDKHEFHINEGDGGSYRWTRANPTLVAELLPYSTSTGTTESSNGCASGERCCEVEAVGVDVRDGRCMKCISRNMVCP